MGIICHHRLWRWNKQCKSYFSQSHTYSSFGTYIIIVVARNNYTWAIATWSSLPEIQVQTLITVSSSGGWGGGGWGRGWWNSWWNSWWSSGDVYHLSPEPEKYVLVEYRIIHWHHNNYNDYDLNGYLIRDQLAKIMVRALTDQKFEQPYEWPARGKDYRNDLLELRITDYKYLPWDTKTTVSMVKTMIIRWLLYRGLKDEAKDIYNTIKWWDVFITRGEILDMITNNLLIHLGFVESTDKGITWKLRISATRINALNIGNIEKEQILWPINDKKVHKAAPKINVYKFDSTLVRLSQEKLKNLKLYDWPIDWIANEELQTAVDIYIWRIYQLPHPQ